MPLHAALALLAALAWELLLRRDGSLSRSFRSICARKPAGTMQERVSDRTEQPKRHQAPLALFVCRSANSWAAHTALKDVLIVDVRISLWI